MIVDASTQVAILYREPEAQAFVERIDNADVSQLSVANTVELLSAVESQHGPDGMRQAGTFLRPAGAVVEPVTLEHGELARQAFLDCGKGGRKSGLHFGDGVAQTFARATGEVSRFKGGDLALTDLQAP
jgi:ribonuclease VapC